MTPLMLTEQSTLASGSARSVTVVGTELAPPGDYLVDEITLYPTPSFGGVGVGPDTAAYWVGMRLSGQVLVNDLTPLNPIPRRRNRAVTWTWRLPRPMLLRAGEFPSFTIQTNTGATVPFRATLRGRLLDPGTKLPRTRFLPFATVWQDSYSWPGTVLTRETTPPSTALYNPHREEIHVERFTGLLFHGSVEWHSAAGTPTSRRNGWDFTTLTMFDSMGTTVVPRPVPWGHLFNPFDNSWVVNTRLPGGNYYIPRVVQNFASTGTAAAQVIMIGMVGHREVAL